MKKKFVAIATAAMCMAGSVNMAFASQFADINDVPWPGAAQYIDEAASLGLMAGYTENGKRLCKAKNSVTYNEAVQLMYSIMCQYNSANKASETVVSKWTSAMQNAKIPTWAYECVAYGLENSILTSNDIKIFMSASGGQNSARREDVAVIFGKALAKVYGVNQSAVLTYKDKDQISASSVPYIELLNRLGLMVGDANNKFNPKVSMNKAEMAVLSTKTYKELKGNNSSNNSGNINIPSANEQLVGTVTDVSEESITILVSGTEKTVKVSPTATITYNGSKGEIGDIKETDNAVIVVNNGVATLISAYPVYGTSSSKNITKGTITSISKTRITIEASDKKSTYKFDEDYNDVTLKLDGKTTKDIDDLIKLVKDGENIEAEITASSKGYVTKITATTVAKNTLEGTVSNITSSKITIKSDGKSYSYNLPDDTDDITVTIDGKSSDYDKFKDKYDDKDNLEVKLSLNSKKEVSKIAATTSASASSASGTLTSLTTSTIKIKTSSGSSKSYDLKSDVTVTIDGASSSLSKLKSRADDGKEYTVKLTISGSKVTKIAASLKDDSETTSGRIVSIDDDEIRIKNSDGKTYTYQFASAGCEFKVDGRIKGMSWVISQYGDGAGSKVKAYITLNGADRAKAVSIETGDDVDEKEGSLYDISSKEIEIKLSDGTKKSYDIAKSCSVTIDGKSSTISKLKDRFEDDDESFEIELTLNSDDEVTKIKASTSKGSVTGKIMSIDEDKVKLGEKNSSGVYIGHSYPLSKGVKVVVDGDEMELEKFIGIASLNTYEAELTRNGEGTVTKIVANKK